MILSIGYERLSPADLAALVTRTGATLVDVRGGRGRTKAGFGHRQLADLLGDAYEWWGESLGNMGENRVTAQGLERLAARFGELHAPHAILMCQEEAPGECHRHHHVAVPLLDKGRALVRHLFRDEVVNAMDLETAYRYGATEYRAQPLAGFFAAHFPEGASLDPSPADAP